MNIQSIVVTVSVCVYLIFAAGCQTGSDAGSPQSAEDALMRFGFLRQEGTWSQSDAATGELVFKGGRRSFKRLDVVGAEPDVDSTDLVLGGGEFGPGLLDIPTEALADLSQTEKSVFSGAEWDCQKMADFAYATTTKAGANKKCSVTLELEFDGSEDNKPTKFLFGGSVVDTPASAGPGPGN